MPEPTDGPLRADIDPALEDVPPMVTPAVDETSQGPRRGACRTELHGWAGGHLHGAVRPRRRVADRGRPPSRWC